MARGGTVRQGGPACAGPNDGHDREIVRLAALGTSYQAIATELDCTLAQLAIAWCAKNPHVSTVITGASRVEQVHENLAATDVLPKLTDDVLARIDAATA